MFTLTTAGRLIGTASAAALLLLGQGTTATPGLAQPPEASAKPSPNLTWDTAGLDFQYDYVVTFVETGLGKQSTVNYELVSNNPFSTWQCFIRKSATDFRPKGQPQPGGTEPLKISMEIKDVIDGSAKGKLSLREIDIGNATCSKGEFLCRTFVSYADNTLTDRTNRVSAPPLPDTSTQIPPPTDKTLGFTGCFPF